MTDNQTKFSEFLNIPENLIDYAEEIAKRIDAEKTIEAEEEGEDPFSVKWSVVDDGGEKCGIWLRDKDGDSDISDCEYMVRTIIEELKIKEPFVCTWADTCSRQRIGEFGGGAFVVMLDHDTLWINPSQIASNHIKNINAKSVTEKDGYRYCH